MICTNHSNFCQTLFLSSLFHFTKSIILLVLFFYYENQIKQMRNYAVDRIANPVPSEPIRRVSVRAISSFVDTSENNAKKIRRHDRRRLLPRGWGLDVHCSFHESLKTNFDWSESLALSCELLKLSYDWLLRSQTTMQTTDDHI